MKRRPMLRVLLAFYPGRWRRRYGAEIDELVSEVGLLPADIIDLASGALREWWRAALATTGGEIVVIGPAWRHPKAWGAAGAVLAAPTLVFVTGSLLAYQGGWAQLVPWLEGLAASVRHWPILDVLLAAGPAVAFVVAVAPLLRLERTGEAQHRAVVLVIRVVRLNLLIAGAAVVLGSVVAAYVFSEWLLEAGR